MRIVSVIVQNYRSIIKETSFDLGSHTTLVGPNNEGKTNLLRALELGMEIIKNWSRLSDEIAPGNEVRGQLARIILGSNSRRSQRWELESNGYSWERDFPISRQEKGRSKTTTIRLNFELNEAEIVEYRKALKMRTNNSLPVLIKIGKNSVSLEIPKQGTRSEAITSNARRIANFITERITFVSIPAIRTGKQAQNLINVVTSLQLETLLDKTDYYALSQRLNELRATAVADIEKGLSESIRRFAPKIQEVRITTIDVRRSDVAGDLLIDDGVSTSIDDKGDGIKSLVAMALIEEVAKLRAIDSSFILAVDEPEAHLHSESVHQMKSLLEDLSREQQVLVATHNAILVNTKNTAANILVRNNHARPASSIAEIRESMGIRLHDNLASAEIVVLVEGTSDAELLKQILSAANSQIAELIGSDRLVIKHSQGASRMGSLLQREQSTICRIFCILDNDDSGRTTSNFLTSNRHIREDEILMLELDDSQDSELEDLIDPDIYVYELSELLGVSLERADFNKDSKWSESLKKAVGAKRKSKLTDGQLKSAKAKVRDVALGSGKTRSIVRQTANPLVERICNVLLNAEED